MSGRIHRDRIPTRAYITLPPEVRTAVMNVKNDPDGAAGFPQYGNMFGGPFDGPPLPKLSAGCSYHEADVGEAHPDDPLGQRGRRRLVLEVDAAGQIREIYYTEEHYAKGSFIRIV